MLSRTILPYQKTIPKVNPTCKIPENFRLTLTQLERFSDFKISLSGLNSILEAQSTNRNHQYTNSQTAIILIKHYFKEIDLDIYHPSFQQPSQEGVEQWFFLTKTENEIQFDVTVIVSVSWPVVMIETRDIHCHDLRKMKY